MNDNEVLLIIGAGTAGAEFALAARQQGWTGPVILFGEEAHAPYHRPPLSKAYLAGAAQPDTLALRAAPVYATANIEMLNGAAARVTSIDTAAHEVVLADGSRIKWSKLALCTGGRPRPLGAPGLPDDAVPSNLHYLRTRDDADRLRPSLAPGRRIAIVGGGYVGLEVAASARKLGADVTLIESQPRVLARVTGPQLSRFYESVHEEAGVRIRTSTFIERVECAAGEGGSRITALVLGDGTRVEVDAVVAGVGMLPNTQLAEAAGLEVDGGIVVDAFSRTSHEDIYAAGDCTVHTSELYARRLRLESVPNALEQARAGAMALCGKPRPNRGVPWFWSDQYDLKLQMTGLSQGYDQVVMRGSVAARSFVAFYLLEGRVIAADAVNRPAEFMFAKKLVEGAAAPDIAQLADVAVPLKGLLAQPAVASG